MTDTEFKLHKFDMAVSEVKKENVNGVKPSALTVAFSGNDINIKMINALRRVMMLNLPSYAFPREMINIEANTTAAFNNDYMKLRLGYLPILGVDTGLSFLHEKYWNGVNYADPAREKHTAERSIDVYINSHNNSANIVNVTTDDVVVYLDGEEIKPYDSKFPILIIKLRPNDTFKCHLRGAIGVPEVDARWRMAKNVWYTEVGEEKTRKYQMTIKGNNQTDEYEILVRACKYLIKKLENTRNELVTKVTTKELIKQNPIKLKLDGEDHTLGEILNYELQDHPDIIFSGVSKTDHLVKAITLTLKSIPSVESPLDAVIVCLEKLIKKFNHLGGTIAAELIKESGPKKKSK